MAHLLHIDASPRGERSHSRKYSGEFVRAWRVAHPDDTVTVRDIGRHPLIHVTEDWVAAAFAPLAQRTPQMADALRLSDELVDELLAADVLVVGVPMYNFGMPSGFKAYIDQIIRVGRTFSFDPTDAEHPCKPLVSGKKLYVVSVSGEGGFLGGGYSAASNHLHPHLRTVFGFIGISDIDIVHVEYLMMAGDQLDKSMESARQQIDKLVANRRSESVP